jgi:hypothetical protein
VQALQAIRIVQAVQKAKQLTFGWMYVAVTDEVTCRTCLDYENQLVFSDEELDDNFPDRKQISEREIYPNVHMTLWGRDDQCRCRLFPYGKNVGAGEGDGGDLPKVPTKVSDEEFDDWLTGLLSAGYITAAIYDKVVARRKLKRKEENKTK